MSHQVVIEIPDEEFERASRFAARVHRDVRDLLREAVLGTFPFLPEIQDPPVPLTELMDDEIIRLVDQQMPELQDERLAVFLDLQQTRELLDHEKDELRVLMGLYSEGTLRKSEALVEAVRRGIRPRLGG